MKYDISKATAPAMPHLGKGTECIKLLCSRHQKTCRNPSFRCFTYSLRTHQRCRISYPDLTWKEPTGMMGHLVADSGNNKGQLGYLVEAMCRDFRLHDDCPRDARILESISSLHFANVALPPRKR